MDAAMRHTPHLLRRCDLPSCEKQAHFTLSDGRVICDKHAFYFGFSNKIIEAVKAQREAAEQGTDLLEQFEDGHFAPGDEHNGLKKQDE